MEGRSYKNLDSHAFDITLTVQTREYRDYKKREIYITIKDGLGTRHYTGFTLLDLIVDDLLSMEENALYFMLLELVGTAERKRLEGEDIGKNAILMAHCEGRLKKSTSKNRVRAWVTS